MRVIVGGAAFDVSVKTSTVNGNVLAIKPEYEDLKKIAHHLKIPLHKVRGSPCTTGHFSMRCVIRF